VLRGPPTSARMVARAEGYTHAAKVGALSLNQKPFPVAPCQTRIVRSATFCTALRRSPVARSHCPQEIFDPPDITRAWILTAAGNMASSAQERRFKKRMSRSWKRWKLSPMDLFSRTKWEDYSKAKVRGVSVWPHQDFPKATVP
jgi:hypothetical protein